MHTADFNLATYVHDPEGSCTRDTCCNLYRGSASDAVLITFQRSGNRMSKMDMPLFSAACGTFGGSERLPSEAGRSNNPFNRFLEDF